MESLIFSEDVCRLCLWRSNKLLPIFSDEGELQGIPTKIGMCLPISVSIEDGLPHLICSRCIYKLEMFSEFRNSCVRSDQLLKRYTVQGIPSTSQLQQFQQTNVQQQNQLQHAQQTQLHQMQHPQIQQIQQTQFQQTHIQNMQPEQQGEQCQDSVLPSPESVKVEIVDSSPVSIQQHAFMCMVPDQTETSIVMSPASQPVEQVQSCTPVIESVNSISTGVRGKGFVTDLPTNESEETAASENRRVLRRTTSLKTTGTNLEPSARKITPLKNEAKKDKKISSPVVTARRNMHRCKHCSKCFPSRLHLSRHLQSSNCLIRYTCRYCAKIFGSTENRIQHERNHQDKKNFICRMCKQKFQSSFDLNVHMVQGCEKPSINVQQATKKSEIKKQPVIQGKNNVKVNGSTEIEENLGGTAKPRAQVPLKCKHCNKIYTHRLSYQKHIRSCGKSFTMARIHDIRRKLQAQNLNSADLVPETPAIKAQGHKKVRKVYREEVNVRPPSRRKRKMIEVQSMSMMENPLSTNLEKSPKASLLHSLGLQEKQKQVSEIHDEALKNFRATPEIINCDGDEVVTVCDICRKIFTSETGMLNHQISVHNRNLTAEKMHSLMRVEI